MKSLTGEPIRENRTDPLWHLAENCRGRGSIHPEVRFDYWREGQSENVAVTLVRLPVYDGKGNPPSVPIIGHSVEHGTCGNIGGSHGYFSAIIDKHPEVTVKESLLLTRIANRVVRELKKTDDRVWYVGRF